MRVFIALLLLTASFAANMPQPLPNFNIELLIQGTAGLAIDWYINSAYSEVTDYGNIVCSTWAFLWGENFGLGDDLQTYLNGNSDQWEQVEKPFYYNESNQALIYSDAAMTKVKFIVVNWTENFLDGYEINHCLLAVPNGDNWDFFGLTSSFVLGQNASFFDISTQISQYGAVAVLNVNYWFLENFCFVETPGYLWKTFTNASVIAGTWDMIYVYDAEETFNYSTCAVATFDQYSAGVFGFGVSTNNVSQGTWNMTNDPNNATVFIGYFFGNATSDHVIMQVFYHDALGNYGITDQFGCWAALISKNASTVGPVLKTALKTYINKYASEACPFYNANSFFEPHNLNC